jgi:signal transduction histidine kinase
MVNKKRLYWSLQLGGWALYAIIQIVFSIATSGTAGHSLFLAIEAALCLVLTHAYRTLIVRARWMSLDLPKLIPRVAVSLAALSVLLYFLRVLVSAPLGLFNERLAFNPVNILGLSAVFMITFFLWTVFYFIYHYIESYNKSLRLEASLKETELNALKSQLNPHFIFNALNSIRALVDENPEKCKQAINQLSNMLRNLLVREKRGLTSFSDELKMVSDYLSLESIRFEERLRVEWEIDPESNDFMVPPLMIQTLVENGIKHGISKLSAGGLIRIETRVEGDFLKIHIRNSGRFVLHERTRGSGLGLENTRHRLKLIYGDEASLRIVTEKDNFVSTEIIVPHLYTAKENESTYR